MLKYLAVFALISGPVLAQSYGGFADYYHDPQIYQERLRTDARIAQEMGPNVSGPADERMRDIAECFRKFDGKRDELNACLEPFNVRVAPRGAYLQGRQ